MPQNLIDVRTSDQSRLVRFLVELKERRLELPARRLILFSTVTTKRKTATPIATWRSTVCRSDGDRPFRRATARQSPANAIYCVSV